MTKSEAKSAAGAEREIRAASAAAGDGRPAVELKDVDSEGNVIVEGLSEGDEVVADAQNVKEGMYVY